MSRTILLELALVLGVAVWASCADGKQAGPAAQATQYHCPMHPSYTSDGPGSCPICGMDLVPSSAQAPHVPTAPASITVSDAGAKLAGVRSVAAERRTLERTIRTVGTVVPDETRVRTVSTRVGGWVEKLHVSYTGQVVRRGEPLLSIYSPELVASQEELIQAVETQRRLGASPASEVRGSIDALVASARRRLELFDVPARTIDRLVQSGRTERTITLLAPIAGVVLEKNTVEGQRVEVGSALLTVADLSRVWVQAALYESEATLVRLGQEAHFAQPFGAGQELVGKVVFISPVLRDDSRTLEVRFDFDNSSGGLKPGMYLDVTLAVQAEEGLVVPRSAILDTGQRRVVYVDGGDGRFTPRQVEVGIAADGWVVVRAGVTEGEKVAAQGNFLLDSEARMQGDGTEPAATEHQHEGAR